ncbi:YhcH/YjgK/YiaL family protein [Porphyromonas sp. oral taxon 279 str. F0450]|uniref:YhcH/YjgK/YiaL family protein n=1 Tax=Porphyromonas sp. oral taxon 279 TaxID=712438 RepID=UPI00027C39BA|nr:YhcH/YjgK/YiaL family protein [Porphyromonas sp. oral taxon 279]EJU16878.1 YhcH/YjgK/YiaL family protein [Porphyromonas sp. oral taxon 279 str. F0450]
MIHCTLDESARYESLHPRFKEVFDYIKSHDLQAMEPQRLELRGEELFINRIDAPSNPQDEQPIEAHESYIDIQVLLEGRERIGWLPRAKCLSPRAPYDESKDIIFYHDQPTSYVDLLPGDFVILFPEDGHAPFIGDGSPISKLIVKVRR